MNKFYKQVDTTASNNQTVTANDWFALICCVIMFAGALYSRAVLSIGMMLLFANALYPKYVKEHWKNFVSNKFALCCILFFCSYLLSGIWSENKTEWLQSMQVKLPFLIMPFALLSLPVYKRKFTWLLLSSLLLVLFSGMLYSIFHYFKNPEAYYSSYHFVSSMEGDYVRFTISAALGVLIVGYFLLQKKQFGLSKSKLAFLYSWLLAAVVYIHLQAAKSGIVALYLILGVFFVYWVVRKLNWIVLSAGLLALILAIVGFSNLPSIENQISNLEREKKIWDSKDVKSYKTTGSVLPRLLSYQIAFDLIKQQPLLGVGVGDVKDELKKAYKLKYPMLSEHQRIIPHNQLIYVIMAIGFPLSLFFVLMIFAPLYGKAKFRNVYLFTVCLVLYFGLTIESMLEVQFGVFVYLFFTSLWINLSNIPSRALEPNLVKELQEV